jgi:hypothetical protein
MRRSLIALGLHLVHHVSRIVNDNENDVDGL